MGDVTSQLARRLNRNLYGRYRDEMVRHHNLSVRALRHADKEAYKAVNKQAHEAFGKYFFSQAGAFTLSIWPVPFAMAWMELRFGESPGPSVLAPRRGPECGVSVLFHSRIYRRAYSLRQGHALLPVLPAHPGLDQTWRRHGNGPLRGPAQTFAGPGCVRVDTGCSAPGHHRRQGPAMTVSRRRRATTAGENPKISPPRRFGPASEGGMP